MGIAACRRFREADDNDMIEEFSKVKQNGNVEKYIDKFEELKAEVIGHMPQATEQYYISVFVTGLKEELRIC